MTKATISERIIAALVVLAAVATLLWLLWLQAQQISEPETLPVHESTPVIEVNAPQGMRCVVMINRYTNEPEDLSCVTDTTTTPLTYGERPLPPSRTLKF